MDHAKLQIGSMMFVHPCKGNVFNKKRQYTPRNTPR